MSGLLPNWLAPLPRAWAQHALCRAQPQGQLQRTAFQCQPVDTGQKALQAGLPSGRGLGLQGLGIVEHQHVMQYRWGGWARRRGRPENSPVQGEQGIGISAGIQHAPRGVLRPSAGQGSQPVWQLATHSQRSW